jgi:ribosomal protein S27E
MAKTPNKYNLFCAHEQATTPHNHLQDPNNEVILQCTGCGRVIKFPTGLGQDELKAAIRQHRKDNKRANFELAVEPPLPDPLPLPTAEEEAMPAPTIGLGLIPPAINKAKVKSIWEKLFNLAN